MFPKIAAISRPRIGGGPEYGQGPGSIKRGSGRLRFWRAGLRRRPGQALPRPKLLPESQAKRSETYRQPRGPHQHPRTDGARLAGLPPR